jgi:hypothetical protein
MAKFQILARLADFEHSLMNLGSYGPQKVGSKRYQVTGFHLAVHYFLQELALDLRTQTRCDGRLLPLRADFRRIAAQQSGIGLLYSLQSNDPIEQRLAVWLLGRRGWPKAVELLRDWPTTAPLEMQFEIARTLKRLRAWVELQQLEQRARKHRLDAQSESLVSLEVLQRRLLWLVRWERISQPPARRDYQQRLGRFLSHELSAAEPLAPGKKAQSSLWYQEPLGPGRQPKSHWLIRWFLERIRGAVRG